MIETATHSCLVGVLKKLKQSSKEAVENLTAFSDFKKYMHITRPVEKELDNLVLAARQSPRPQLILVCGSVGDGKSHVISYLNDKYPWLREEFYLHNDATESFEPQKTSIETLAEYFHAFSDDEIDNFEQPQKAILAINLGALNNFIDSEYGKRFTKLRMFVEQKKILESAIEESTFDEESNFQYINFSDYHLYELTPQGPTSTFIKSLIQRVVEKGDNNPFYAIYSQHCRSQCPVSDRCPLKHNYEFLGREKVQDKVVDVLVQAMIKEKIIVSTRSLLNFIHDILVAARFESLADQKMIREVETLQFEDYVDQMLPVLMYSKADNSRIHQSVSKLSPTKIRSELLDEKYIEFRSRKNGADVYADHIDLNVLPYFSMELQQQSPWLREESGEQTERLKNQLVSLFVYLYFFVSKTESDCFTDEVYDQFMRYLYYSNTKQSRQLANLYREEVRDAIFNWEGKTNGDLIFLQIGKSQNSYQVLQKLEIEPYIQKQATNQAYEESIPRFLTSIKIAFQSRAGGGDGIRFAEVEIDYLLYELIDRIRKGYRPSQEDRFKFIKFVEFVDKISSFGNKQEELIFEAKQVKQPTRYKLAFDMFGDYTFTVVNNK